MCGKERLCTEQFFIADMFDDRPCNAKSVKGGRASADFVEYEKTLCGRVPQNICNFIHLHHKGTLSARQIVRCADTRENSVNNTDIRALCGDKAAKLCHQHD